MAMVLRMTMMKKWNKSLFGKSYSFIISLTVMVLNFDCNFNVNRALRKLCLAKIKTKSLD